MSFENVTANNFMCKCSIDWFNVKCKTDDNTLRYWSVHRERTLCKAGGITPFKYRGIKMSMKIIIEAFRSCSASQKLLEELL